MDSPQTSSRSPVWVRLLLAVSLGLNLLIVGTVIGAIVSGGGPGPSREASREFAATPFVRALSREDRRALLRDLRRERDDLRESGRVLRDRFERLLAALRAENLDEAALDAILAEQRSATQARQTLGERLVVARVLEMTPAERRAYADRLEAEVKRPRRQ